MKKIIGIILVLVLMLSLVAGCSQASKTTGKITVIDSEGNEVIIEKTPERIIALMPSDVEIIYALGAEDKLVAVGEYANYPEDVKNKQVLGSGGNTSVEELIDLEPDVILIGQMSQTEDQVGQLKQAGIAVVISNSQTIEDAYTAINMIGRIVEKSSAAEKIVNDMKAGFAALEEKSKDMEVVNVYVEVTPLQFGLWTFGQGTFIQEILDMLNINNVFGELSGWGEVSEEQVIDKNPDIILTTVGTSYGIEDPSGDIVERENWQGIKAVKDSKVYMIDSDKTGRPGPRLLDAAQELFDLIHGE